MMLNFNNRTNRSSSVIKRHHVLSFPCIQLVGQFYLFAKMPPVVFFSLLKNMAYSASVMSKSISSHIFNLLTFQMISLGWHFEGKYFTALKIIEIIRTKLSEKFALLLQILKK